MPLSDKAIKAIKPADKVKRYTDEKGLYLEVAPSGGKLWRLKYRYGGKEKRLSFGAYPDTSLKRTRERRRSTRPAGGWHRPRPSAQGGPGTGRCRGY